MAKVDHNSWQVPASLFELEYVVKKSRFIARVLPVADRAEVNAAVTQSRLDYPDARHHCWAYLLGRPSDARGAGMSDDGEPAGTAGKPILNVLQHGTVGDVLVIVIRYFGGIKLGAGGLVRAYSSTTQQALDAVPVQSRRELVRRRLSGDFAAEQSVRHFLGTVDGVLETVDYSDQASFTVLLESTSEAALEDFCAARGLVLADPGAE
jgi:uncharacterized YigZ family protein